MTLKPLSIPSLSTSSSVRSISISSINGVEGLLPGSTLQSLHIHNSDDPSLCFRADNFQVLNYLKIREFLLLQEFNITPQVGHSGLTSLNKLSIEACPQLTVFPAARGFPCLRCLFISDCELLESFADDGLPLYLQTLCIKSCKNLKSLPDRIFMCTSLQLLEIFQSPKFELFPASGLPPNLQKLMISDCSALRSLPDNIQSLMCLEVLFIQECPEIGSFPPGSLPPNLQTLHVENCSRLFSNYEDWQLGKLVFLKELRIMRFIDVVSFPGDGSLPSGLTGLHVGGSRSLMSINCRELQRINCLRRLEIRNCSKLNSFFGEFPQSLNHLVIFTCPLTILLQPDAGKLFSHIPYVDIDSSGMKEDELSRARALSIRVKRRRAFVRFINQRRARQNNDAAGPVKTDSISVT